MPRLGIGLPLSASQTQASVLVIDDPLFESFGGLDIAVNYTATRTNLTLYAQDTTQSQWVKTSTGIEGTLYEDPNGGTTGNAITGAASNSTKFIHQVQEIVAGETYTYSAYVKKGNLSFVLLEVSDGTTTYSANFGLNSGGIGTTTRLITSAVDDRTNGWYRCSITFQALNSSEGGQIRAYAMAADNTPTVNVAVADTVLVYIWGQQFEADGEPTEYIATTTAARTATSTLIDNSKTWDFDSNDIMPEADPDSEGSWEVPDNVVLNGDYEELGSELVTSWSNKDFSSFASSGSNITQMVSSGSGNNNYADATITSGKTYKLQFTSTQAINCQIRTSPNTNLTSASVILNSLALGTNEVYFTAPSNYAYIGFYAPNSFTDTQISSFTLKQVDPNDRWTLGTGWSISSGKASFDASAASTFSYLTQASILPSPLDYELTFTLSDLGGSFAYNQAGIIRNGIVTSFNTFGISAPGTHTIIVTETSGSNFFFFGHPNSDDFSIDNVSVKEYAIQPKDI